jgi:ABC-type multidrug transport system fused ATPase/permease subunit
MIAIENFSHILIDGTDIKSLSSDILRKSLGIIP